MALALTACSSWSPGTQNTEAMAEPPAAAAVNPMALWWQRFNDPLLSTLVSAALQANTSVRSAQAALQQARAVRDLNSAGLLPTVFATGSAQRSRSDAVDASNSWQVGLDASWELDVFGGKRNTLNAAEADAQALQATLGDVLVSVAAEVALAYVQLRGLQAQLMISGNNLKSQQETLQITDWRAQAGLTTSLEVEQARTASEQTSALLPVLQASIAKTSHSLAVLTGQTPQALQLQLKEPLAIPQVAESLALDIPAETLRQRPDVRAAELRVQAALERVSAADAARYPAFSIGGSVGLNALTLGALGSGTGLVSALLGSVSVPLFDGGAAKSQVLAQEAALEQARAGYQSVVLNGLKDVEDALVALSGDRERLTHLQSAAVAAGNADLLAQYRYRSGLIDFQTVLQTQRTLLVTQDSVASATADVSADHVRLYKALGGGWN